MLRRTAAQDHSQLAWHPVPRVINRPVEGWNIILEDVLVSNVCSSIGNSWKFHRFEVPNHLETPTKNSPRALGYSWLEVADGLVKIGGIGLATGLGY